MTFPDVHLAGEAVVAFVDNELASFAHARALAHLDICAECRRAVGAQREASRLLAGASAPDLPAGLLGRLRDIPMTTELDGPDVVLAVEGGDLVWGTASSLRTRPVPAPHHGERLRPGRPDPGAGRRDNRPASYPSARGSGRTRGARRVLAGAVAGLAFGVCVATASMSVYSHTNTPDRNLIRDVNGGVIRPPVTGELTGVHNLRAPDPGRDGPDRSGTGPGRSAPQRTSLPPGSRTHGGTEPIGPSSSVTIGNGTVESVSGAGMR